MHRDLRDQHFDKAYCLGVELLFGDVELTETNSLIVIAQPGDQEVNTLKTLLSADEDRLPADALVHAESMRRAVQRFQRGLVSNIYTTPDVVASWHLFFLLVQGQRPYPIVVQSARVPRNGWQEAEPSKKEMALLVDKDGVAIERVVAVALLRERVHGTSFRRDLHWRNRSGAPLLDPIPSHPIPSQPKLFLWSPCR